MEKEITQDCELHHRECDLYANIFNLLKLRRNYQRGASNAVFLTLKWSKIILRYFLQCVNKYYHIDVNN